MDMHDPIECLQHKLWSKEGRELKCQFDYRPLKVKNHFKLRACKWHATYCWKSLDEGYNFSLKLVPIKGLHKKWWESWEKMTFGCALMVSHREYYKGGRWWLPPSLGCDESNEFMYAHGLFVHQKCSNHALTNLLFGLCRSIWIIDPFVIHSNPHLKVLVRPFYPQSVVS
jgi:hypothetical protein